VNLHLPVSRRHRLVFILLFLTAAQRVLAQNREPVSYVDPFIGTAKSSVPTKWGSEGGTYPGAVAPSGYLQLTPETRVSGARGYDYSDSVIYYFSCFRHFSGFPGGSAGNLFVMPVDNLTGFRAGVYNRPFSHKDEKATPGYYSVLFRDNNTRVEATATTRAGMFRFTFPAGVTPQLFISDTGAAVRFSESYTAREPLEEGYMVRFKPASSGNKVILLSLSVSTVSRESAARNIAVELNKSFDQLRENTRRQWAKALSVIDIADSSETNKTIFYTALYHALLMPWVISDVDGHYRGADRQLHRVVTRKAYGGFSPWDTFRSLHPLLSLLYPDKQREMMLSMLDIYQQSGHLPIESMTGNHAVPIIVDSYLKGVTGIDSALAYTAMKKSIADTPYLQNDMAVFRQQGYIPFSYPESVTRTVEYAYDDWALAQFAGKVAKQPEEQSRFTASSYAYRQLFHPGEMSLLPRDGNTFKLRPGTTGYKEGDQWIYSYFVPHHEQDLVNLLGGRQLFTQRLDSALSTSQIIFDNETVFHIPWLFNAAGAPHKTQQWIGEILHKRFSATPGGLPGNDDLGSVSSWYIFSAMGVYPACPGRPEYTIGTPLFRSLRIHLQNGRTLEIKRNGSSPYIKSLTIDGKPYNEITVLHKRIVQGGTMIFETAALPAQWPGQIPVANEPVFTVSPYSVSKEKVEPHEPFWVRFSLKNGGSLGTKRVQLEANGKVLGYKNCLADSGVTIIDSIPCRLYRPGDVRLILDGVAAQTVTVVKPSYPYPDKPDVRDLVLLPLLKKGEWQQYTFTMQNTGGEARTFRLPVILDDSTLFTEEILLEPGEEKQVTRRLQVNKEGWHALHISKATQSFRVYNDNKATLLLDLQLNKPLSNYIIPDHSGFGNNGSVIQTVLRYNSARLLLGPDTYVEVPNAPSLDVMGSTITMMAWVFPTAVDDKGLVDLFTKGDVHVLQVSGNSTLTFFAGGWGRGDVSAPLPADWKNNWHHVAGVCDGKSLRLYIDGQLKASTVLEDTVNLSVTNKWNIGRNEEFPSARIFNGYMDKVKVFAAPLSEKEVLETMGTRP
jgi:putative alpha-1,2-mannosidase